MPINWDAVYNQAGSDLAPVYDDREAKLRQDAQGQQSILDAQKKAADDKLKQTLNDTLTQAYITRAQNERNMGSTLAAQGLSGGPAETTLASLNRGYQNTRNSANKEYTTNQTALDSTYQVNTADLGSKLNQMLADLRTEKTNAIIARAQQAYNAQIAEDQLALQREQWDWQKQQAAMGSQSGYVTEPSANQIRSAGQMTKTEQQRHQNSVIGYDPYAGMTSTERQRHINSVY